VDAIQAGCRYGVIASGDDHTAMPGGESRNWGAPLGTASLSGYHHMGLACIRAKELTRESLWTAMRDRSTYGTTFDRSLIDLRLGELGMGESRALEPDAPDCRRRWIKARISLHGAPGARVTLVRNGEDIATEKIRYGETLSEISFPDHQPLAEVAVRGARHHPKPFVAYYLRVQTSRHETQWTSPLWLDLPD
jgi:hypothetical protein